MELAKITVVQVGILFIMMALGFILLKCKIVEASSKKSLSNMLVYVITPCVIVNSYFTDYDSEILHNLLITLLISFIVMTIGIIIVFLLTIFCRTDQKPILRFAGMFSNSAFMGFPLIEALFGSEWLIYASSFLSIFNIYVWTLGIIIIDKQAKALAVVKNIVTSPAIIALVIGLIVFLCRIPVPQIISKPIEYVAAMNTPLAMIITGMIIASSNIKATLKNVWLWLTVCLRLVIIPAVSLGVIVLINTFCQIETVVLQVVYLLACCPCASITSAFAVRFGYNEDVGACSVVFSTILSIITLPLCALIISLVV